MDADPEPPNDPSLPSSEGPVQRTGARLGKRQLAFNAVASYAGFLAQILVTLIVAPILIRGLGDQRCGIWALVESVLVYLLLLDMGLTASIVRYVSKYEAINDVEGRNRLLSTNLCIFTVVGLIALGVALGIGTFGLGVLKVPPEMRHEAWWMFALLGVNLAFGLPMSLFTNTLFGLGRYPTTSAIRIVALTIRAVALVAVVRRGGGLIPLGFVLTGLGIAENLAMALAVRHHLPDLRISPRLASWETFQSIWGYSFSAFVQSLAQRLGFQSDAIVISVMLGPQFITPFAIAGRLVNYAKTSLQSLTGVITPTISAMDAKGDLEAIRRVMIKGSRYVLWVIVPIEVGLIALGKPFLTLWIDAAHAKESFPTLVILSGPLVLAMSQTISARILFGTDGLSWLSKATIVQSLASLSLSVILAPRMGIEGVAWGMTIPYIIYNLAVEHHVCRRLGLSPHKFFAGTYLVPVAVGLPLAALWAAAAWFVPMTWARFVATGALGMALYVPAALMIELGPARVAQIFRDRWPRRPRSLSETTLLDREHQGAASGNAGGLAR